MRSLAHILACLGLVQGCAVLATACGASVDPGSPVTLNPGDAGDAATGVLPGSDAGPVLAPKDAAPADAGSEVCQAVGTFCGGPNVTGGDPGTLYICGAAGSAPATSTVCLDGCGPGTNGADQCTTTTANPDGGATGSIVCPSSGLYCGGDVIKGDPNTLYTCPGSGQAPSSSQVCASGCQVEPQGTNDLCKGSIVCPGGGDYCGGDSMSGDVNTLYHCAAANQPPASSQPCANGCQALPAPNPDVCRSSQTCPGTGDYCGSDGVQGGDANTLYHCPGSGKPPSGSQACASGCTVEPAGTNDFCAATSKCPSSGAYCGNDGLNGPANVLYQCSGVGASPGSPTICTSGCSVQPSGTPDYCIGANGGGCNATEQTALNWEANQLNTGHPWSDLCLGFVNNAFKNAGDSLGYLQQYSAADALAAARNTGRFVNWNGSCPCGGILFWGANSCNGEDGHIVICNGDGTVSTSGWPGFSGSTHAGISWLDGMECGYTPAGYILP